MISAVTGLMFFLLPRRFEHIFDEYAVSFSRVVDQDVRYRSDDLAVLNDRTARHTLDDAAGGLE